MRVFIVLMSTDYEGEAVGGVYRTLARADDRAEALREDPMGYDEVLVRAIELDEDVDHWDLMYSPEKVL